MTTTTTTTTTMMMLLLLFAENICGGPQCLVIKAGMAVAMGERQLS
ncbi:hypothetical protein M758_3G119600 [Ceratodon purpureus]|nr:hypothetical protein M758_3G119600 [Ceratodon purpureus]